MSLEEIPTKYMLDIESREYKIMIEEMKQGKEKVKTPWGIAKINRYGYYIITSGKQGNNGKMVHRLIWEGFNGCKIPEGYHIHHRNHIKNDNSILNLQLVESTEHQKIYHNSTGFLYVCKFFSPEHSQGFAYKYTYPLGGKKKKQIYSVNLDDLYSKVKNAGLPWEVVDREKAKKTIDLELNKEVCI